MAHQSDLIAQDIEGYLKAHENKEMCRFITCGSVDDGKSTLIGRLLYDSKMIFEDQLSAIEKDSKKYGTTGKIDLALLVDGLASEREQGITIDVAYRYFSTQKRKFIIADTPGHEQYTRNMATGASTADIAIVLIDARKGVLTQTKRHSFIVSLLGIKNIIVAINKMDLVDFKEERFEEIKQEYKALIPNLLHHKEITFRYIPLSALDGDNIVKNSDRCSWYKDKPLMTLLDTLEMKNTTLKIQNSFRFPVQYVNRPNLNFRGFCGTIASGEISVGENITVLPSNKTSKIKEIISSDMTTTSKAFFEMSVTLTLEDEIDISRGDVIIKSNEQIPHISNQISAMVVWMNETPMKLSQKYLFKLNTNLISGVCGEIIYKKEINTFEELKVQELHLNDIAKVILSFDKKIVFDVYNSNKTMGSFIIIDRYSNETVGAGMIVSSIVQANINQTKIYTKEEIELNKMIREKYPEWECKAIYE